MKTKTALTLLLCIIGFFPAFAQNQLFIDAFEEFSTSRLWEFEEIPIDWKMEGLLQADLNEGLNNLIEGNLVMADESLTTVVEKDSSIWQAYYYRAAVRKRFKKFGSAEIDMRHALKLHGDFYEGFVELAKILYLNSKLYDSERAINKAVRMDRYRGAAYYVKGDINMSQNEVRIAINNYKECLLADSLFHNARIKLALLDAVSKKNVSSAMAHLDKVLAYDSLQKNALLFRSILNLERNKKQSVKDLTNLILVSPNNLMALWYRGLFSAELGDYERGFNDFRKVIDMTSTSDNNYVGKQTWLDKKIDLQNAGAYTLTRVYGLPEEDGRRIKEAYCHILTGEYDKSIAVLDQMSDPGKEPVAVYLRAVAYEHMGVHVKALQQYSLALALDKEIADAYKKRGIYEQELKQWDQSVVDFTAVLRLYPDAFFTNRLRGVSFYHLSRFTEALEDFNTYLKNDSTNKEVRGFRGMAYAKTNQRLKAYVDFAMSDNYHALNFRDMEHLVDSVLQLRDTAQALQCVDLITESTPYFTEGYAQKFRIHMARNQWKPIADNISRALRHVRSDVDRRKHSYLLTLQALVYARQRHDGDAVTTLNEAIRFDRRNDFAFLERGRLFLRMGKSSKAESDLREASVLGNEQARELLSTLSD